MIERNELERLSFSFRYIKERLTRGDSAKQLLYICEENIDNSLTILEREIAEREEIEKRETKIMEPNKNPLFFLGFLITRTKKGIIRISDTRYKGENNESFKRINGILTFLPVEELIPYDIKEHGVTPVSIYTHVAEAADAFFNKLNEGAI